jgi:hypothetical protein
MKPLTPKQKAFLASLAREGWNRLHGTRAIDEDFDTWRRREAVGVCGVSISQAKSRDFDALHAHFLTMAGKVERAFKAASNELPNDLRNVLHCIEVERKTCGVAPGYVSGICRRMYGHDSPADAREAKAVLVALVRKRQKLAREAAQTAAENGEGEGLSAAEMAGLESSQGGEDEASAAAAFEASILAADGEPSQRAA